MKIIITGGKGFLGSHLCEALEKQNHEVITFGTLDYDLTYEDSVQKMFSDYGQVDMVFHLAATVGGIGYNQNHPYDLFFRNAKMGLNIIHHSMLNGVKKFIQIGTVCAYPKFCNPPFNEASLWDGYPEETNAPYGLAKRMLLVQLQAARKEYDFNGIYLLPTNLYGPGDEFNPERSHVIPALIKKCLEAKAHKEELEVWGTGNATRDFLYVKDAVEGIILAAEKYDRPEPLNLGSGHEIRISTLLHHITNIINLKSQVNWDQSKPDGQPRRSLNVSRAKQLLGWQSKTSLTEGLTKTIEWYEKERIAIA